MKNHIIKIHELYNQADVYIDRSIGTGKGEKQLIATVPESIDSFVASLKDEAHRLRSNAVADPADKLHTANLHAGLRAVREAITNVQELKIKDVADISGELNRIYDAPPTVDKIQ